MGKGLPPTMVKMLEVEVNEGGDDDDDDDDDVDDDDSYACPVNGPKKAVSTGCENGTNPCKDDKQAGEDMTAIGRM